MMLSAEELLAGSDLTFDVTIPAAILRPGVQSVVGQDADQDATVLLRPLTVHDLQLISKAAKDNDSLVASFMVQRALVEPLLSIADVRRLPAGVMNFLLEQVNKISGLSLSEEEASENAEAPLVRATYILAKEFGWTPQEINNLTIGQVVLHLQMLKEKAFNQ